MLISAQADEAAMDAGKALFKNNCAQCHAKNMKSDATGPALGGAQERWADYPEEDLYAWIRNSQGLVAKGHPRAVSLYNEWNKSVMQPFPNLTDENISNLLSYVNGVAAGVYPPRVVDPTGGDDVAEAKSTPTWLYYALFGFLALLALLLARICLLYTSPSPRDRQKSRMPSSA